MGFQVKRALVVLAVGVVLSAAVSGCGLDAIEGKPSAQREHIERLAALEAGMAVVEAVTVEAVTVEAAAVEVPVNLADGVGPVEVAAPALAAPALDPVDVPVATQPEPVVEPPEAECVPVFRITACEATP